MVFESFPCLATVALTAVVAMVIAAEEINIGEKKIIGGQTAHPGVFTALVAIYFEDPKGEFPPFLSCEGTLISKWTVLTTGDCVNKAYNRNGTLSNNLRGRVGSHKWKEGGQVYSFCSGVTHPQYNPDTFKYNIGFLYTRTPVVFSKSVHPMKMDFDHVGANVPAIVAGWGVDKAGNDVTDTLQQLFVITVDGKHCAAEVARASNESDFNFPAVDPTVEICAVNSKDHGVCSGDGGSTLIRLDRGAVIGHVTWGIPCATGAPDVFARLSAMKDWFLQNIQK